MERRQQRMTLKEYIHSNSLRKKAMSRANSRGSSKNQSIDSPSYKHNTKEPNLSRKKDMKQQLVEQIKMKLAQLIASNQGLVSVMKLVDSLVQIYNKQIHRQFQQNSMMSSIIRQKTVQPVRNKQSLNQSIVVIEDDSQLLKSQNQPSFHPLKSHHMGLELPLSSRKQTQQQSQEDSVQIPSIKYLLTTRLKNQEGEQINTKDTNLLYPVNNANNETLLDSFRGQRSSNRRTRKNSTKSNMSSMLDPNKFFNQEDQPSQIRFSIRSSFWGQGFEPIALKNPLEADKHLS